MSTVFSQTDSGNQKSAFNELLVTEPFPVVAQGFTYNLSNDALILRKNGSGTSAQTNSMAVISTAAANNSFSQLLSRKSVKYVPGQGIVARFAGFFVTGATNSTQYVGYGSVNDAFAFGYQGTTFGVLRRYGGSSEVRTLTITTKSSTLESVTVTLNGVAKLCPVTNGADSTVTANEIAAVDFSEVGTNGGWQTEAVGNTVIFRSYRSGSLPGAYSVAGSTIVGAFASSVVGVAANDTNFVAQSAWSDDRADAKVELPILDWTKGQVFQIRFQWLGYGMITFYVENPATGKFVLVHRIQYAGTATTPSITNPSLPFMMEAANTTNATVVGPLVSSFGIFHEGENNLFGIARGIVAIKTGITTETPVLTIRNKSTYASKLNRIVLDIHGIAASSDGTKNVVVRVYLNATLVAASFTDVSASTSPASYDTAATSFSGGTLLHGRGMAKVDNIEIRHEKHGSHVLNPGEQITVTIQSAANVDMVVGSEWEELF